MPIHTAPQKLQGATSKGSGHSPLRILCSFLTKFLLIEKKGAIVLTYKMSKRGYPNNSTSFDLVD